MTSFAQPRPAVQPLDVPALYRTVARARGARLRALLDAAADVARGSADRRLQDLAAAVLDAARTVHPEAMRS
ncbi:MAG: hypothetical protein K6V97_11280 [Actinomycetia bacterium]|nr:hypothetical protein [Actinomycetes bacterium]